MRFFSNSLLLLALNENLRVVETAVVANRLLGVESVCSVFQGEIFML